MKILKHGKKILFSLFDEHGVKHSLIHPQPSAETDNKILESWQYTNKVCRHTILKTISNEFFDVYYCCEEAKVIWEALIKKSTAEDATKKKICSRKILSMADE